MKAIHLFCFLLFLLFTAYIPQKYNPNYVDPIINQKTWVDDETREINGFNVTRVYGYDYGNQRNEMTGMITTACYKPISKVIEDYTTYAKTLNKTDSEIQIAVDEIKKESPGGRIQLYVSRYDREMANFRWFMIIVRDSTDKNKLFEKQLTANSAKLPEGNFHWNYTEIDLPKTINTPFYIYVSDRKIDQLAGFKFKISEIEKTTN